MDMYIKVILTLLTIITGILTIATFINGRKKESNNDSRQNGIMEQKIINIDSRTEAILNDIREMQKNEHNTSLLAMEALASAKSAHKRIDALEKRVNNAK